jgi:hypothetical protein
MNRRSEYGRILKEAALAYFKAHFSCCTEEQYGSLSQGSEPVVTPCTDTAPPALARFLAFHRANWNNFCFCTIGQMPGGRIEHIQ